MSLVLNTTPDKDLGRLGFQDRGQVVNEPAFQRRLVSSQGKVGCNDNTHLMVVPMRALVISS